MLFEEIIKEKIIINKFIELNSYNLLSLVLFIFIFYCLKKYIVISPKIILIIILICIILILFYDEKLSTNIIFSKNKMFSNSYLEINYNFNNLKTGDLVFFRCFENNNLADIIFSKIILPLPQNYFFTHVGMIYKDINNKLFILENNGYEHYCMLTKKIKSGPMLLDFNNRMANINNYRIHIVTTNIINYLDIKKLEESINKYKNYEFSVLGGLYCVNYLTTLLNENKIFESYNILPLVPSDLLDTKNYLIPITYNDIITINKIN